MSRSGPPSDPQVGPGARRFEVDAASGRYPVLVGAGLIRDLPALLARHAPAHRYAVISDATVGALYAGRVVTALRDAGLDTYGATFPAGEASKSRDEWARLTDALVDVGLGRDGVVVALGGGVTGDLAGFVAATYLRGVSLVQVPTSLLAMVDASIGGKTGVDTPAGKNLVGAFHAPRLVVTDPELATSLSPRARAEGLVEAVKHGATLDIGYLEGVEADLAACIAGERDALTRVVEGSVAIKARVVSRDEREDGYRSVLNFGHTLGHGIEAASSFRVGHGPAVALGMVLEARLGERLGVTETGTAARLAETTQRLDMPATLPSDVDPARVLAFTGTDKKSREGRARYVLLRAAGTTHRDGGWTHPVPAGEVEATLRESAADTSLPTS